MGPIYNSTFWKRVNETKTGQDWMVEMKTNFTGELAQSPHFIPFPMKLCPSENNLNPGETNPIQCHNRYAHSKEFNVIIIKCFNVIIMSRWTAATAAYGLDEITVSK